MADIYRIEFGEYLLEVIPSAVTELDVPIYAYLDSRIISDLQIEWEIGDFPFGVISPKMTLEINYNIDDDNLTSFIDVIQNPLTELTTHGLNLKLKNVFRVYKDSELYYTGIQDTGVEGTYEGYRQTITTTYIGRYILEQFDTKIFKSIVNSTVITPPWTIYSKQSYIEFYNNQGTQKYLTGHTTPSQSQYFWYFNLDHVNQFYAKVINIIGSALLRKSYEVGNTLYNESQETTNKIFTLDNSPSVHIVQSFYKQTYTGLGTKGDLLADTNLHFLGIRATDEWVDGENNVAKIIDGLFYDKLNSSYKTMWDFFIDFANQTQSYLQPSGYFFKAIKSYPASEGRLLDVTLELRYNELSRVSSSLTESFENDIDNYETYTGSSRTDNSLSIPITFYNYPTASENYQTSVGSGWDRLFELPTSPFVIIKRLVNNDIKYFGLYYIENPTSSFNSVQAVLIHNYVGFGATEYNLATTEFDLAEAMDIQSNGCYPKILADYVLNRYSGTQVKVSGKSEITDLYPKRINFDITEMAPPRQPNIFDGYSFLYYVTKYTYNFIEDNLEIEALGI